MKTSKFLLLFCLVPLLTGCPREPATNLQDKFIDNINDYLKSAQIKYDCSARRFQYSVDYRTSVVTCNDGLGGNPSIRNDEGRDEAKRIRNEAIEKILPYIDRHYTQFIDNLEKDRSTTDFIADIIDVGTGAATGISNGARSKTILGI